MWPDVFILSMKESGKVKKRERQTKTSRRNFFCCFLLPLKLAMTHTMWLADFFPSMKETKKEKER
jgi:hypothetical protein